MNNHQLSINETPKTVNEYLSAWKAAGGDIGAISDGYHTFDELYEHRCRLFIVVCMFFRDISWCSKKHSDGSEWPGWFILGLVHEKSGQITYHLPEKHWEKVSAVIKVLDKAPEWDGHTSQDVLNRLDEIIDCFIYLWLLQKTVQ